MTKEVFSFEVDQPRKVQDRISKLYHPHDLLKISIRVSPSVVVETQVQTSHILF